MDGLGRFVDLRIHGFGEFAASRFPGSLKVFLFVEQEEKIKMKRKCLALMLTLTVGLSLSVYAGEAESDTASAVSGAESVETTESAAETASLF